jgi:hypothetical protein
MNNTAQLNFRNINVTMTNNEDLREGGLRSNKTPSKDSSDYIKEPIT